MNILLILVDQMRYDAAGFNGAKICRTPVLDQLAGEGICFDRAYTANALCSPARASILSGLYPHKHGQLANIGNFNGVFDGLPLGRYPTYFSQLKARGYTSGYIGKWHLPDEGNRDFWDMDIWHTGPEYYQWLNEQGIDYDMGRDEVQPLEWGDEALFYGASVLDEDHHHDGWVTAKSIEAINQFADGQKPFVMCSAFHGPHFPYAVPAPYHDMYSGIEIEKWNNFDELFINKPLVQQKELLRWNTAQLTWRDWQKVIAAYWGYCTFLDSRVGMIIEALKQRNLYEDTMIVFTADHGDMLGSHRLFNKGFNMYEEDHHIPMLVRKPGMKKAGARCPQFVSLTDLMPTFIEAGGGEKADADGRSLMPWIDGPGADDWRTEAFCEFNGYESTLITSRMIRNERWKYIYNPFDIDELYDLDSDPGELHNLAGMLGYKHVLRRMKEKMIKWLTQTGDGIFDQGSWQSNSYDLIISDREK